MLSHLFQYLRPHRLRLVAAIICMFGVGFFGTYNLLLVKPVLDVLFGNEKVEDRRIEYRQKLEEHRREAEKMQQSSSALSRTIGQWREDLLPLEKKLHRAILNFYIFADKEKFKTLQLIALALILASMINGLFAYSSQYHLSYILFHTAMRLKNDIFGSILRQDLQFFGEHPVGWLMSRIGSDVSSLRNLLEYLIKNVLQQVIQLAFIISFLFVLNTRLTLIAFIALLPAMVLLVFFAKSLKKVTRKQKKKNDALSALANESLQNITLIKALNTEEREKKKFHRQNRKIFELEMKRRVAKFAASPLMVFLGTIGLGGILILGGYVVLDREAMDASTFILYLAALGQLYRPLKMMGNANVTWQTAKVGSERIQEIMRLTPKVLDPPEDLPPVKPEVFQDALKVENVTFAYQDKVVLENTNLHVPKGAVVAIVGRSGSGKSTLANLLLRFYDPQQGQITLDGTDIRHIRLRDLRSFFGIVSQQTILFDDTIANNIAYGTDEPDSARVEKAARMANAHDFIMELDGGKGYDSPVGPGGGRLSGGQRQRIAIARAFYRDPEILVLDEATSALDNESEAAVQQALRELMAHRTVIVIAHRLSTVMHADNIVVLHNGRIVEQGRHSELLEQNGHYANLYKQGDLEQD